MRTCSILSALVLACIAVPALAISVLYNGIAQTILVSPSYIAHLSPESLQSQYQHLAPYIVRQDLAQGDTPDSLLAMQFPEPSTRAIIRQILIELLNTHDDNLSTNAFAQQLDTDLPRIIRQTIANAPTCTDTQTDALTQALSRNQQPSIACAPPTQALSEQLVGATNQLIRMTFDQALVISPQFRHSNQDMANRINEIRAGAGQSIMIPATLIIIIVAFAVRSRRQLFGWISGILLSAALLGLLITFGNSRLVAHDVERFIVAQFADQVGWLLPVVVAFADDAFPTFITWSIQTFLVVFGVGVVGSIVAIALPKPIPTRPRNSQPLGQQPASIGDGSTNRVKTDFETDALFASNSTLQLPPGLDTSKLTFGRRLPKIPQPTQQITDVIPAGDHTTPIPVDGQTETLDPDTQTQELGPKSDSRATQRTDEHRF